MSGTTWFALVLFLVFAPSASALLLWRKLGERRYIEIMPADVPDGNGEWL